MRVNLHNRSLKLVKVVLHLIVKCLLHWALGSAAGTAEQNHEPCGFYQ